jgi:hypothetical protein
MSNILTSRSSSPGAVRMRRYRKQRRQGLRSVRILLDETDRDALIRRAPSDGDPMAGLRGGRQ